MILKKAKNLCHVIEDREFEPRGDAMDLVLEDQISWLQLRSLWARRFEMLKLSTLASEGSVIREALHLLMLYASWFELL